MHATATTNPSESSPTTNRPSGRPLPLPPQKQQNALGTSPPSVGTPPSSLPPLVPPTKPQPQQSTTSVVDEVPPVCSPPKQKKQKTYEFKPEEINTTEVEPTGLYQDIYPEGTVEQYFNIGNYLGKGSFAKVYHAKRADTQADCAIKIIDKILSMECDKVALITEIQLMSVNQHPHIVTFSEAYETPSRVYVIMEFLSGGNLFDINDRGKFWTSGKWSAPYQEAKLRAVTKQVIEAVKYLHDYVTVHRDLKPDNILFIDKNPNAAIKLIDFGMAKTLDPTQKEFQQCGTPEYQAPEMLSDKGYDLKLDMWSVGIMLYLLITGHFPFEDKNLLKLRQLITQGNIPWHFNGWNSFSEPAKDFVKVLLQSNPESRLTAADALAHPWLTKE